jgi:hypothetical protein
MRSVNYLKMCILAVWAALVAGVPAARAADAPAPAAILTVVSGDVQVKRGDEILIGEFGTPLRSGDVVKTGQNAEAAVFFETGQIIELGPGSSITVGGVPNAQGTEPLMAEVPEALSGDLTRFAQTSLGGEGLSAMPTLRGAGEELAALSPRNTRVLPGVTTFTWTEVDDVLEYRLVLAGPGKAAGSHRTEDTSWTLPAESALGPGEQWTWHVEAITAEGTLRSEPVSLEVASADAAKEREALESRLQPLLAAGESGKNETAIYLLGSYLRSAGFYEDAIVRVRELQARHPDRDELHRELGYLYQATGRHAEAAAEYRLALDD